MSEPRCERHDNVLAECHYCCRVLKLATYRPAAPAPAGPLPCAHRGEPTGETIPCTSCGGKKRAVPVLACAKHGRCTLDRLVAGAACCRDCDDRTAPSPEAPA